MKSIRFGAGLCAAIALAGSVCIAGAKKPTAGEIFIEKANIPNMVGVGVFASVDEINKAAHLFLTQFECPMASMMGEPGLVNLKGMIEEQLGQGRPGEPIVAAFFVKENKSPEAQFPDNLEPSVAVIYPTTISAAEFPAKFGREVTVEKEGKEFKIDGNYYVAYTDDGRYAVHGTSLSVARKVAAAKCLAPAACKKFLGGNVAAFAATPYGISLLNKALDSAIAEAAQNPELVKDGSIGVIKYCKDIFALFKAGYASFGIDANGIVVKYGYIPAAGISVAGNRPVPDAVLNKLPASTLFFISESIGDFERKLYTLALNFIKNNQSFAFINEIPSGDAKTKKELISLITDTYVFGYKQIIDSDYYASAIWIDGKGRFGGNSVFAGKSAAQHSAKAKKLSDRFQALIKKNLPALKIEQAANGDKCEVKAKSIKALVSSLVKKVADEETDATKEINIVVDKLVGSKITVSGKTTGNTHESMVTLDGAARPAPGKGPQSMSARIKAIIPEIDGQSLAPDSYAFVSFSGLVRKIASIVKDVVTAAGEQDDPDFAQFKRVVAQLPAMNPVAGIASASFTSKGAKNSIVRISAHEIKFFGKLATAIINEAMASAMNNTAE